MIWTFLPLVQYLEARSKGRVVTNPGRDSRQGLDVAYLSALTTAAKLAEEEVRIKNHFVTQTMTLKVGSSLNCSHALSCCEFPNTGGVKYTPLCMQAAVNSPHYVVDLCQIGKI